MNSLAANVTARPEQPRWLKLRLTEADVGTEVESYSETRAVSGVGSPITHERLSLAPIVGLKLHGSVFHPNTLRFTLGAENGLWSEDETLSGPSGGGFVGHREKFGWLQRYHATATFLRKKPYAATLTANKDHSFRDYDFFTRVTVDRENYGARLGYSRGPVPVSVSLRHLDEQVTGWSFPTSLRETALTLDARNERKTGQTDLSYEVENYARTDGGFRQTGLNQYANLLDTQDFGQPEKLRLNSSLLFTDLASSVLPTRSFTALEHFHWQHTDDLESNYDYGYNHHESGELNNAGHHARAELRHQFCESITSTLDLHGQTFSASSPNASTDTTRYGVGWGERYTKKLGSWGRLTLDNHVTFDQEERRNVGALATVINESHTLNDGVVTFLKQPRVLESTIRVTDRTGTAYQLLLHYLVVAHGEQTELRRVPGVTGGIPDGGPVLVSYSYALPPSDSFQRLADLAQIRLDLFDKLFGVYARLNTVNNYGGQSLVLQEITDQVAGADVNWRWLRVGAEYEHFDSNLSPFRSRRVFENLNFNLGEGAKLTFDFSQNWIVFLDANRDLTSYQFIGRLCLPLSRRLAYTAEGGVRVERGVGFDQNLATARTSLDFRYGKLSAALSYDYQDQQFLGELRTRHFFYLRVRRAF